MTVGDELRRWAASFAAALVASLRGGPPKSASRCDSSRSWAGRRAYADQGTCRITSRWPSVVLSAVSRRSASRRIPAAAAARRARRLAAPSRLQELSGGELLRLHVDGDGGLVAEGAQRPAHRDGRGAARALPARPAEAWGAAGNDGTSAAVPPPGVAGVVGGVDDLGGGGGGAEEEKFRQRRHARRTTSMSRRWRHA